MDYDFLIIGGGVAGLSAAAELAPMGKVLVWEAEPQLAYHASARSAALYEPRYGKPAVVALSLASEAAFNASGTLTPRGLMMVAKSGEETGLADESREMGLDLISAEEAVRMVPLLNPDVVTAASFASHAWDIDTDLLIQGFLRQARSHGAEIVADRRIDHLSRQDGRWHARAKSEEVSARIVINAAGAWVDQIAVMAGIAPLGFVPCRRSMARIPAPTGFDIGKWPMLMGVAESWYMKPDAGALIVSPSEADPMEPHDAWADDMVLAEGLARYEEFVTEPVTRLLSSWAGLRTKSPDGSIVIGESREGTGFYWLAGQSGQGFQSSFGAARLLTDLIAGRAPEVGQEVAQMVSPLRFGQRI